MALRTLGTTATTSLTGLIVGVDDFPVGTPGVSLGEINVALLNNGIKEGPVSKGQFGLNTSAPFTTNVGNVRKQMNQCYSRNGYLIIPRRGKLVLYDGDIVAIDATTGWPIVISADAAANGPWNVTGGA